MAVICMFFPALLMCYKRYTLKNHGMAGNIKIGQCLVGYIGSCVFLNLILLTILVFIRKNTGNVFYCLNQYNDFALKYLSCATFLAIIVPYIERYLKENVDISWHGCTEFPRVSTGVKKWLLIMMAIVLFFLHFIRIFNHSFWGDEGIVIVASRMSWMEMLDYVAICGHSPFHYVLVWIFCRIFGESGILYHFVSVMPYLGILVLAVTVIRKRWGEEASAILMVFTAFLDSSITYNLEVRMYSWCQLFLLATFLLLYRLLEKPKGRYYLAMTMSSLGAVYCHYYALAAIGIIYLVLFLLRLKTGKRESGKVFASGIAVIEGLLPWLLFCHKTTGTVINDYGMEEIPWRSCFEFIFYSRFSLFFLFCFTITFLMSVMYGLGILIVDIDHKKIRISVNLNWTTYTVSAEILWCFSGVCAVLGTIVAAKFFSSIFWPILVLRYLYPSFVIAWLVSGICISKLHLRKQIAALVIVLAVVSGWQTYLPTVKAEYANDQRLLKTLECTADVDMDDFITTDINHFNWTVSQVYYPDVPRRLIRNGQLPVFDLSVNNWLFLSKPISDDMVLQLSEQNCAVEKIVSNGYIGTGNVWIYRVREDMH